VLRPADLGCRPAGLHFWLNGGNAFCLAFPGPVSVLLDGVQAGK